jgi:hypothetical protein
MKDLNPKERKSGEPGFCGQAPGNGVICQVKNANYYNRSQQKWMAKYKQIFLLETMPDGCHKHKI